MDGAKRSERDADGAEWTAVLAAGLVIAAIVAVLVPFPTPLRAAVTLPAALWAPGHALVAAALAGSARRLTPLEDAAASVVLSLAVLPVVALVTFLVAGVSAAAVASALALVTVALLATARARGAQGVVPAPHPPGTHGGFAWGLTAGAFVLAVLVASVPFATQEAPPHLALVGPDGSPEAIPRSVDANASVPVRVEAGAGDAAREGRFVVRLSMMVDGAVVDARELANATFDVPAGSVHAWETVLGPLEPGTYRFDATWAVEDGRFVRAWFTVGGGAR